MILVLDIGNTNVTIGAYDGKKLLFVSRLATDRSRMEDQYMLELRDILNIYGLPPQEISGVAISSVVPCVNTAYINAVKRLTGAKIICAGPNVKTGITVNPANVHTIGADLITGCAAAAQMYDGPFIVLDMGTATTFMLVDENKNLIGGAIAPGVGISLDALVGHAARLTSIDLKAPAQVIGRNTAECMASGIVNGTSYMIDGMCDHIEEELGRKCCVIATGGLSHDIIKQCSRDIDYCGTLILDGLRIIYEMNT